MMGVTFQVQVIPGVVVYRFLAPICFVNCKVFLSRLDLVCGVDRLASSPSETQGCIQSFFNKVSNHSHWLRNYNYKNIFSIYRYVKRGVMIMM